jgi:quercetin dioxygenase-like cupin family protein
MKIATVSRLLALLALEVFCMPLIAVAAPHTMAGGVPAVLLQDPGTAKFVSVPGVPACVTMAPLRGNLGTGPATVMVKMTQACVVPYHWHTPSEELIVLRGAPLAQMQGQRPVILKVGSYSQLPSTHTHRFRCESKEPCLIALVTGGVFDIHFVDEAGKEITTEAALAAAAKSGRTRW